MKDDGDLNDFLLKRVAEKEKIVMKDDKEVSGNQLIRIMGGLIKFYDSLDRLSRKGYNKRFIEFLASYGPKDRRLFKDKDFMTDLFQKLDREGFLVSDVQQDEDIGVHRATKMLGNSLCIVPGKQGFARPGQPRQYGEVTPGVGPKPKVQLLHDGRTD